MPGVARSPSVIAGAHDITIRPLRDHADDYAVMSRWLSDERVLQFYDGRDRPLSYEDAASKYGPRALGEHYVRPCIIELAGRPIGYIQYYPVDKAGEAHENAGYYRLVDPGGAWAIDMFIGEPDIWGRGMGSSSLAALAGHIFSVLGAQRIVIDPHVDNPRAIRAYEKAGFRKQKVLKEHEFHEGRWHDAWLMTIEREDWANQEEDAG